MKNLRIIILTFLFIALFSGGNVWAQEAAEIIETPETPLEESAPVLVNIEIKNKNNELVINDFPLAEEGTISIADSSGATHDINSRSVLAVLSTLDKTNSDFKVGELIYYPSFNALYLRCMKLKGEELCDNWVYEVNGESPSIGMDNFILEGEESIKIYYSSFWGEPEPEEEVVADPEPVQTSSTSSGSSGGGRRRTKPADVEEAEMAEITALESTAALAPVEALVPAYIMYPEFYTPEEPAELALTETEIETQTPPANSLAAAVGESGATARITYITASILFLIFFALIAYKKLA